MGDRSRPAASRIPPAGARAPGGAYRGRAGAWRRGARDRISARRRHRLAPRRAALRRRRRLLASFILPLSPAARDERQNRYNDRDRASFGLHHERRRAHPVAAQHLADEGTALFDYFQNTAREEGELKQRSRLARSRVNQYPIA